MINSENNTKTRQSSMDFEVSPMVDATGLASNSTMNTQALPETLKNSIYTPAFLRKHIGNLVKVEFLIGNSFLEDRTGILLEVGASYIVLRGIQDSNLLYCDIYSIRFVTISRQSFMFPPTMPQQPYNQQTYPPNYTTGYMQPNMQAITQSFPM